MIYAPFILILFLVGPVLSAIALRRSLSIRWHLALLGLFTLYAIAPLLLSWGGLSLANRLGCEGGSFSFNCPNSELLGALMTGLLFAHWLAIATIPSAILGCLGLLISVGITLSKSRKESLDAGHRAAVFYRSRRHKVLSGVCGTIAQKWHLSLLAIRIVTVVLAVVLSVPTLMVYVWFWVAFPLEPPIESPL